ncbi:Cobalt-precorrin-4 C(11)-methyltransferase [Pelotomaculum schinkii]|uniref:Cobalt-precorrin-4 C(11)-methyltransferase n=1 Tax=Pelotomaculum schinkii TaxID=78350 RepID=A0A4Y7RDS4_9FIRM|nr:MULTISPECIES: precorrin-4 C(11)-methyltransferase [Pelotomaculum]TEB06956.1 Cobalt-precorrin-4 C(11)-methyltransferase [Pelotomaculum schinkii]TEB16882.1 Cobalt-precorrin-4 C(11)-methyltransferase [Pelotomaculum sp. FP]
MIYFIGAGPGDPELITVKGARLLAEAEVVIYTGSLVNPALLDYCKEGAEIHNSAGMSLKEIIDTMVEAHAKGKRVARVHTGDPALFGAIQEQMDELRRDGIPFSVIPGVSSFLAAAAAIPHELTLPGVTQTVILTRAEGRTPVPAGETLSSLAGHGATMCIFLSVHMMAEVVKALKSGGYTPDTPVIVVERASWPEQRVIHGTIEDIEQKVMEAGVNRTAQIMVGKAFGANYEPSRLYDTSFDHTFRGPAQ